MGINYRNVKYINHAVSNDKLKYIKKFPKLFSDSGT